jgi:peptidoglycan/LPS O-acetylase OafA/YrhL
MISGFVILMTLDKCSSIKQFLYRRWLRLFPAMLICTAFVYLSASLFHERPAGQPEVENVLPGLFFIEPYIWEKLFGFQLKSLEGAFWSLYIEFKFYIIASIIYFLTSRRNLVIFLFTSFIAWVITSHTITPNSPQLLKYFSSLLNLLGFEFFGWFAAGASYYLFTRSNRKVWMYFGLSCALISSVFLAEHDLQLLVAASVISLLFHFSIINTRIQSFLSNRIFLFFGFISYPFYLIHEGIMISMIIKINRIFPSIPDFILTTLAIGCVSIISYYIAKKLEKPVKNFIRTLFSSLASFAIKTNQ